MNTGVKQIVVRLDATKASKVEKLRTRGGYATTSDLIRELIDQAFEKVALQSSQDKAAVREWLRSQVFALSD